MDKLSGQLGETLFMVFLILKLTDVIQWSWWYVTMPLIMPTIALIFHLIGYIKYKKN